jgi:hypothetical protein
MTRMTSSFAGLSDSISEEVYDAEPPGNGGRTRWGVIGSAGGRNGISRSGRRSRARS